MKRPLTIGIEEAYKGIEDKLRTIFPGKLRFQYFRQFGRPANSFNITFEIAVIGEMQNEDYGLVLATNGQSTSHFDRDLKCSHDQLFLTSDLFTTDNKCLDSTDELILDLFNEKSNEDNFNMISDFISKQKQALPLLLNDRYHIQ